MVIGPFSEEEKIKNGYSMLFSYILNMDEKITKENTDIFWRLYKKTPAILREIIFFPIIFISGTICY